MKFDNYIIDEYMKMGLDSINNNEPIIFITGKAGVGKSTFIQYLIDTINKNIVVLAPTGIAALNVCGQTIHSFFRFPPKIINNNDIKLRGDELLKNVELLIIDEISMVRADILDGIDYSLQLHRKNNKPFGGVQMLLIGDCYQLPPIVSIDEKDYFYSKYHSYWFFDFLISKKYEFKFIELKNIYRQSDLLFINLLNCIREQKHLNRVVNFLNHKCYNMNRNSKLYLTSNNIMSDEINKLFYSKLTKKEVVYHGNKIGNFISNNLPVPDIIKLKPNTRIMIKKNINGAVNGSLGVVVSCHKQYVKIKLDIGSIINVYPETWVSYSYEHDKKTNTIQSVISGKYTQIPLILGWSITIHKSQSLTLDSVEIDVGDGCFAHGQCYTAISRCKTIEGISLNRKLSIYDIIIDTNVVNFYNLYKYK